VIAGGCQKRRLFAVLASFAFARLAFNYLFSDSLSALLEANRSPNAI
jgi:hypothetical protein